MTNLRDWQKKASERRNELARTHNATKFGSKIDFKYGFDSRDAEIDLLLQIIEKQSEALEFYGDEGNWWVNTAEGDSDMICKSDLTKTMDNCGGKRARTTQAEVQKIVEQLKGEEK